MQLGSYVERIVLSVAIDNSSSTTSSNNNNLLLMSLSYIYIVRANSYVRVQVSKYCRTCRDCFTDSDEDNSKTL